MATTAEELLGSTDQPVAHGFGATDVMLLVMATIWGVNYSVIKYASRIFTPLVFNGIRIPVAAAVQLSAGRVAGEPSITRGDKWRLIGLGFAYLILPIARWANKRRPAGG